MEVIEHDTKYWAVTLIGTAYMEVIECEWIGGGWFEREDEE